MLDKLILFLRQQANNCHRIGFPIPSAEIDGLALWITSIISNYTNGRLFLLRDLNGTKFLSCGEVSYPLHSGFTCVLRAFASKNCFQYTPALLITIKNSVLYLEISTCEENNSINTFAKISALLAQNSSKYNAFITNRQDSLNKANIDNHDNFIFTPQYNEFQNLIQAFTSSKADGKANTLQKVVISRSLTIKTEALNPQNIILSLALKDFQNAHLNNENYFFAFNGSDTDKYPFNKGFVSYTPETLFTCRARNLRTEALAGSALPNEADTLINDNKNLHENLVVAQSITSELAPLCQKVITYPQKIRTLSYIAHISTAITGTLSPQTSWNQVINSLFPSPAIAGFPREQAIGFIQKYNDISRGLFAGTAGFIQGGHACFAVLLRCAHIDTSSISIFAGAGIMPSSTPIEEWQETAHKMSPVLHNLWPADAVKLLKLIKETGMDNSVQSPRRFFHDDKY